MPHHNTAVHLGTSGLVAAVVIAGLSVAAPAPASASTPASSSTTKRIVTVAKPVTIVADDLNRTVRSGFGSTRVGGRYVTSAPSRTSVKRGVGRVKAPANGKTIDIGLPRARATNGHASVKVKLSRLPRRGSVYVALSLRQQQNGAALRAYARVLPKGRVQVGLQIASRNGVRSLGAARTIRLRAQVNRPFVLAGSVSGGRRVDARVFVGRSTGAKVAWQRRIATTVPAALAGSGSLGVSTAVTRGGRATSVAIDAVRAVRIDLVKRVQQGNKPVTPGKPAPTTPAPTTPAPADPPADPSGRPSDAGSLHVGEARYDVPEGAIVVAPDGADVNAGTSDAPVRTITAGVAKAPAGGTVVVRAGEYHESVSTSSRRSVTVQAWPGEAVWLDGSSSVDGWERRGATWVHDGWTPRFSHTISSSFLNSSNPMAAYPDQTWIDGRELRQVGSAAAVTASSFYVDEGKKQLVIGTDPSGHSVRASDLSTALTLKGADSTVRGIGVRRYGNSYSDLGALRLYGVRNLAENVVVHDNATTGIVVPAVGTTLRHVTVTDNGLLGVVANYADGIVVDSVYAAGNNSEGFNRAPVSGGVKITRTRGITVRDGVFVKNNGPGLWLDESCYRAVVVGNTMSDNIGHGMSFEISDTATIANNLVTGNGGVGFKINDSGNVDIWNNTLADNGRSMWIVQDLRRGANPKDPGHDPRQHQPDATMPWIVRNVSVVNNLVLAPKPTTASLVVVDASKQYTSEQMIKTIDGNFFGRTSDTTMLQWSTAPGRTVDVADAATYRQLTGDGDGNRDSTTNVFDGEVGNALRLPASITTLLGQLSDVQHIGIFGH